MNNKYTPLMSTLADQIVHEGAAQLVQATPLDWRIASSTVRQVSADTLQAVIEDVEYYGETTVSLGRLKRLYEHLRGQS